jgi:hypothetical protein
VELASGPGGSGSINADVPVQTGAARLFLTYAATRGSDEVNIDRPAVWVVDIRLPDTSTELVLGVGSPAAPPRSLLLVAVGLVLLGLAGTLRRRSPTS